jgi:predicted transcriptional regulator
MSISPVKKLILEKMWVIDKPLKATDIAKDTRLTFPTVMMHIIGLTRMGYLEQREKGLYTITQKGKKILGFPEVDKEKADKILEYLPREKSFHFYGAIGKPLNIYAASLEDFCNKILKVDTNSVEFHILRGDFEAWFMELGDIELARKTLLIKEQKILGEELRKKLYETVKSRYDELTKIRKNEAASGKYPLL